MKFIIFLFAISWSAFAMDEESFNKCIKESDANEEEIEKVMNRDIPESDNEKCLMKCVMKEMELINDDNGIDMDGATKFIEQITKGDEEKFDKILRIFEDCNDEIKDNPGLQNNCDASKIIVECIMPKLKH